MTQMEDWLGIILGILFILGPALLEKGNRSCLFWDRLCWRKATGGKSADRDMRGSCSRRRRMVRILFCGLR